MLNITLCTVYLFKDATALVKMDTKSLFNKKKLKTMIQIWIKYLPCEKDF